MLRFVRLRRLPSLLTTSRNQKESTCVNCQRVFTSVSKPETFFLNSDQKFIDSVGRRSSHDLSGDPFVKDIMKEVMNDFERHYSTTADKEDQLPRDHYESNTNTVVEDDDLSTEKTIEEQYEEYEDFVTYDDYVYEEVVEKVHPISLERGEEGVFDVEEVVSVLRSENGVDVCTITVPEERNYVDYMVIATGRSKRHLIAMAQYLKKLYKMKRSSDDPESVDLEGKQTGDWVALDLGNVAVHLFREDARLLYDLETLWTLGEEYEQNLPRSASEEEDEYAFLTDYRDRVETHSTDQGLPDDELAGKESRVEVESFASHSDKWHGTGSF